jgi:hypothetical protein
MIGKENIRIDFQIGFYVCSRYRAALALQITNLLTRAMFARRLNMNDLPAVRFLTFRLLCLCVCVCVVVG